VDAYPPSAGRDGDPISLAIKRSEYYWDRKILIGSTPTIAGASRIAEEFEKGDQRRFYVPCPHCGHMDFLTFREQAAAADGAAPRGHYMKFDTESPEAAKASACFVCRSCGCLIEHQHKRWMVERGEWRADKPFRGHASFAIWAAYSYSPNATWGHIAQEFLEAKAAGAEQLQTFVNSGLGETWVEKGEAPEWQRLYQRRETYELGVVPRGTLVITAGMDVQADRLIYEVVAWADDFQSWGIEADIIMGDTAKEETWEKATELLGRTWPGADGLQYPIHVFAVDSGFNTQAVYNWARRYPGRVIACKGSATARAILGEPKAVDVTYQGKRLTRGCKVWTVGVDMLKSEFYGWLRLDPPTKESGAPYPAGYCHFPEDGRYGEEYFKQITAEHLVKIAKRGGFTHHEWHVLPGRENHRLDGRIYARAGANRAGLDRLVAAAQRARAAGAAPPSPAPPSSAERVSDPAEPAAPAGGQPERSDWLSRGHRPCGGWLR
jgi:phage terminase large subunit GpA-like protein